ncbi:phytoene/squalene synthase family protein [Lysobacter sp. 5GHs7-4]|uniref:squalene/phytoene synthase family protein n=1 Tax=Lysobacter sp. 5GHs7-4 TaxID=2904253 RepID=UPI001E30091D|nr:squalene/phytoene synthase family protein [Lysobacter sp. 5GHs7-4]UHQ24855.1 phytoene/squalene synthase family protein [Lysobacter sp. 5GHs7-4]
MSPQTDGAPASDEGAHAPDDALASFIGKWRARWPEWALAETFVPAAQRETALAWAALQQELADAAWGGRDARPGELKLGWWLEELQGWSLGRRRHPLGQTLQRRPAPWAALAAALPTLLDTRERPLDRDDAIGQLRTYAGALAAVDAALFGTQAGEGDNAVVAAGLLHARLAHEGASAVPLSVLAQAGEDAAIAVWTRDLHAHWPKPPAATVPRRLWAALASARLRGGDAARPLSPWRALLSGWRGARGRR